MKLNHFILFSEMYFYKNSIVAIPELWKSLDWDNNCFINKIKPYVKSQFSYETYADDNFLQIKNINIFQAMQECDFFSMFFSIPKEKPLSYKSKICDNINDELIYKNVIHIGYIPMSELGSPFFDGLYPISIYNNSLIYNEEYKQITLNNFFLIDRYQDCQYLCNENDKFFQTKDDWYPCAIYVDKFTFSKMKNYMPTKTKS